MFSFFLYLLKVVEVELDNLVVQIASYSSSSTATNVCNIYKCVGRIYLLLLSLIGFLMLRAADYNLLTFNKIVSVALLIIKRYCLVLLVNVRAIVLKL
jgi:hypothetical protein